MKRIAKISVVTILVTIILVSTSFAFFTGNLPGFNNYRRSNEEIPLIVHSYLINDPKSNNSTSYLSVVIMSIVPNILNSTETSFNLQYLNQSDNNVEDILYQGSVNGSVLYANISKQMLENISSQWKGVTTSNTHTVSLELNSYFRIISNGSLSVYQYYNNIPYSPGSIPNLSNLSVYFDPNTPVALFPLNSNNSSSMNPSTASDLSMNPLGVIGPGPCPPGDESTTILNTSKVSGPFPLMIGSLQLSTNSQFNYAFSQIQASIDLSFNSNEGTKDSTSLNYTGTTMSVSGSWGGTSYAEIGGLASTLPYPDRNVSMVYLPNVTTQVTYFETFYYEPYGTNECELIGKTYSTSIEVINVPGGNFNTYSGYLYNLFSRHSTMWWAIFNAMGMKEVKSYTLSPGENVNQLEYTQYSTGYTSASLEESKVTEAISTFVAGVGLAFAVNAVFDVVPLAGSAEDAVNDAGLVLASYGLTMQVISDFSSISYSTNTNLTFNVLQLGNQPYNSTGNSFTVNVSQSSGSINFSVQGTQYTFNSPVIYLAADKT